MEDGDPPCFNWQPPASAVYRRRRPPSPPLLSSSLAIILIPCLTLLCLFLLAHTFNHRSYYNNPQYYPPHIPNPPPRPKPGFSLRRSWDSLNVILIVAAILCGVFARWNEDGHAPLATAPESHNGDFVALRNNESDYRKENHFSVTGFQQFADNQRIYGYSPRRSDGTGLQSEIGGGRLRRSSSSYPDFMRQEASLWEETVGADRRLRFLDDFEINNMLYPPAESNYTPNRESHRNRVYPLAESSYAPNREEEVAAAAPVEEKTGAHGGIEIKEMPVDTFAHSTEYSAANASDCSSPLPPSTPPPMSPAPPPPPPPVRRSKARRTYQSVPRKEKVEESAPPPPAPPPPVQQQPVEKKLKRRKSNATKEFAMALASLYNNRKRKRKQRNKQSSDDMGEREPQQRFPPPSPPPPPPPPPPPSVFHSLFKKSSKHKKIHSVSSAPPPPPPPPPPPMAPSSRSSNRKSQIPLKSSSQHPPEPPISEPQPRRQTTKPPLPARPSTYYDRDNTPPINSGSQSPLTPIPPPPPPPPFRIPAMKFSIVRGGAFVQVQSAQSSRAGSPEPEEEAELTTTANEDASRPSVEAEMNGSDGGGPHPAFACPSPDVNAKADTFIARHHNGWRLEKLHSWREKRKPNVGPGPSP